MTASIDTVRKFVTDAIAQHAAGQDVVGRQVGQAKIYAEGVTDGIDLTLRQVLAVIDEQPRPLR